jgi:hypothetical protein
MIHEYVALIMSPDAAKVGGVRGHLHTTNRIQLALFGMQNRTFGPYMLVHDPCGTSTSNAHGFLPGKHILLESPLLANYSQARAITLLPFF